MPAKPFQFDLSGGNLALDFANTVSRRHIPERRREHLESYANLLSFSEQSTMMASKELNGLRTYAAKHGNDAQRGLRKAIVLREALYRAFATIAQQDAARADDLKVIAGYALDALRHRRLTRINGAYSWQWESGGKTPLDRILWPIAQSAADLLTSAELQMVRFCEAPDCEWLFLDRSRNRSRRWCDMASCGNRQKARRHYQRTHD